MESGPRESSLPIEKAHHDDVDTLIRASSLSRMFEAERNRLL